MTSFFQELRQATQAEQNYLFAAPIVSKCFAGDICLNDYYCFLSCAYHHVKHTVPLLMAVGSRISEQQEWLREATAEYIAEELGHQEWILNDIATCGFDKEQVRRSNPNMATELMVAYAYDTVYRVNPLGFFGMVHVLEGTSISTADKAADSIQVALKLPNQAFSYLRSHGALDQEHVAFFAGLMDRIENPKDQSDIIHAAKRFYVLYGNVFRSITDETFNVSAITREAGHVQHAANG